jgi:hypothetical protein
MYGKHPEATQGNLKNADRRIAAENRRNLSISWQKLIEDCKERAIACGKLAEPCQSVNYLSDLGTQRCES